MIKFKNYVVEKQLEEQVYSTIMGSLVLERLDTRMMNESNRIDEGVSDILKKMGLDAHKSSPGVIEYVGKFTKGVGQFIWAGMIGDKAKIKELAQSFKAEDLIDFLLKLDTLTLHTISGPIHAIDAATGWHIWANIQHAVKKGAGTIKAIKDALTKLKHDIGAFLAPALQPLAISKINDIEEIVTTEA